MNKYNNHRDMANFHRSNCLQIHAIGIMMSVDFPKETTSQATSRIESALIRNIPQSEKGLI